jgi:hypothetical protein
MVGAQLLLGVFDVMVTQCTDITAVIGCLSLLLKSLSVHYDLGLLLLIFRSLLL